MALAIDGSTPVVATNAVATVATVTSASFNPPAGALLLVMWVGDTVTGVTPSAPTITDNLGAHLTYTLLDWMSHADSPFPDGQAAIWSAVVGSSTAMTVTVTTGTASGAREAALRVMVITGQHATPIGAHAKAGSTSAAAIAQNFTGTASGSWGFIADCDWDTKGTQTAGTGCTVITATTIGTAISYGFLRRTTADGTVGGTTTLNVTLPGTSTSLGWCYAEVIPAAAAAAVSPTDNRYSQAAYYDRRSVPQQRAYVSDPGLLSTALLEVPPSPAVTLSAVTHQRPGWLRQVPTVLDQSTGAGLILDPTLAGYGAVARSVPATHADRRYVPAQRQAAADVSTATGVFDPTTAEPRWQPATDRRVQPAQRPYISPPDLLGTALLENELLGGATTSMQGWMFTDRRQVLAQRTAVTGPDAPTAAPSPPAMQGWRRDQAVPAQRTYVGAPDLLGTALLENELLGSADDTARHRGWFARAWTGQQRTALADQSTQPSSLDPTTAGGVSRWLACTLAVWAADRRLVPQQRLYVSDPSFYPAGAATDPLTVAWGAGGVYWTLYNTAALTVDRRQVPQQRAYVSDPGLLSTALLEGVLLGGADDTARHRAVFTDRRWVPTPRPARSDPLLLVVTDPTTLAAGVGGDLWRRVNTPATNGPRWVLRTWLQSLVFVGTPPTGAVDGFARPGDGLGLHAGPGAGAPPNAATGGDGTTIHSGGP